jgi:hypothetical protein
MLHSLYGVGEQVAMAIVMVFNAIFNTISAISWRQFYWWRKPEYPVKTTDLLQVSDNLFGLPDPTGALHNCHNWCSIPIVIILIVW